MIYLKTYENYAFDDATPERVKGYFQSKIDWKLVEFIELLLTGFEDDGYKCGYVICSLLDNGNDYTDINRDGKWCGYEDTSLHYISNWYEKNPNAKLMYMIHIKKDGIINRLDKAEKISSKIKSKFPDVDKIDITRFQNLIKMIFHKEILHDATNV